MDEPDYTPTGNFLRDYTNYATETEVPSLFTLWCGLFVISTALQRRCFIDMGMFQIFPNFYILLVAGSGRHRKSTAINIAKKMMNELQPKPNFVGQKVTPEALIDELRVIKVEGKPDANGEIKPSMIKEECCGTVIVDELATFLNMKSYEAGLGNLLTPFWDCVPDFSYKTISRGETVLNNLYLSILGGATVEWVKDCIPEQAIGGGLTSRFIFVYVDEPTKPVPIPRLTDKQRVLWDKLIRQLRQIQTMEGEFKLDEDAWLYYKEIYTEFFTKSDMYNNRHLSGYASRRFVHLFKIAMAVSAAERLTMVITKKDIMGAEAILGTAEKHMQHVMSLISSSDHGMRLGQVYKLISVRDRISKTTLLQLTSSVLKARDLDEILYALRDSGYIEEIHEPGNRTLWYRKTPNVKGPGEKQ